MSADFVASMEEVLDVYHEPRDPKQPVVCFDESSTQLLADVREPTAARPGQPERYDIAKHLSLIHISEPTRPY